MAASSAIVLGALTGAGIWLRNDRSVQDNGYVVDLSEIEDSTAAEAAKEESENSESLLRESRLTDDLDYDPFFRRPIREMWKIRMPRRARACLREQKNPGM